MIIDEEILRQEFVAEADVDGDGSVNYEEFVNMIFRGVSIDIWKQTVGIRLDFILILAQILILAHPNSRQCTTYSMHPLHSIFRLQNFSVFLHSQPISLRKIQNSFSVQ